MNESRQAVRTAAAAAGLALLAACGGGSAAAPGGAEGEAEPVVVGPEDVIIAERGRVVSGPPISGSLEPARASTVRAEISGRVVEVYAERGDRVERGALLARIEAREVRQSYRSAQAGVESAERALELARSELERTERLVEAGALARRELEVARANVASARARLEQARVVLASAEERLEAATVRAPIAGVVSEREVDEGELVSPGTELFTVIDPSSMRLEGTVPATALGEVSEGATVRFRVRGYPERVFTGEVTEIVPVTQSGTRQIPVIVSIPNPGGLLVAGLFAEGRVLTRSRRGLVVPRTAVERSGTQATVTRVSGGRAERVPVALGLVDERTGRVQITSGIQPGDTLLVGAASAVRAGVPVQVEAVRAPAAGEAAAR